MRTRLALLFLIITLSQALQAQDGIGFPSLKIEPAARQAGMAGAAAGVGDDAYAPFFNPGALGHLRRWQWSAAYNRWFAGLTQASFTASRLFRIFWVATSGSVSSARIPSFSAL